MKSTISIIAIMLLMCMTRVSAQSFRVYNANNTVTQFLVSEVDSIVFNEKTEIIPAITLQEHSLSISYDGGEFDFSIAYTNTEKIEIQSPIEYTCVSQSSSESTYHFSVPFNDTYEHNYKVVFTAISQTGDTATDTLFVRQESNPSPVEYAYYGVCTGAPESVDDIEGRTGNYGSTRVVLTGNSYTTPALRVSSTQRQNCCWIACPTGWRVTHWYDDLGGDLTTLTNAFRELVEDNPYGTTKQTIGNYTVYRDYISFAFNQIFTIQINK